MIPAASIEDQEFAVTTERPGIDDPAVTWRSYLGASVGCDGNALLSSAGAVGSAELANPRAVDRQPQMAAIRGKRHRRREPAGILQCRKVGAGGIGLDGAGLVARVARRAVEALFELADQILQVVDLAGEIGGALLLRIERLLDVALPLLPFVNQHVEAQLLAGQIAELVA